MRKRERYMGAEWRGTRRGFLAGTLAVCAGGGVGAEREGKAATRPEVPSEDYRVSRGRIKHSVMGWCYAPMPTERLIEACARMGMAAMEGIDRKYYPAVRARGMAISLVSSHGFRRGPLDPENHDFCRAKLKEAIDAAVRFESPNVITFTGMRVKGISDRRAFSNCVDFWKGIVRYAEEKKVNLCLEHLNTRDDTHPMKGHPGYFGDDVDQCLDMVRKVGSERMKLLFDIYHVQIMNGDVIRRIRRYKEYIGHYHVAGVPGRAEPDENQELNYPAVMRAIVETGFKGYVAQEFIPTWRDKLGALRYAVARCDV